MKSKLRILKLRRAFGLSETQARLLAPLIFGEK